MTSYSNLTFTLLTPDYHNIMLQLDLADKQAMQIRFCLPMYMGWVDYRLVFLTSSLNGSGSGQTYMIGQILTCSRRKQSFLGLGTGQKIYKNHYANNFIVNNGC